MNEKEAKKRIKELKGYYAHLTSYVAVNFFILVINLMLVPNFYFFVFPLLGWGIGLAIHTFQVFGTNREWEARKIEELTGLKETKDEVQRLAERTDALVTILASVDWEKIDPDLLHTRDNLEGAKAKVTALRNGEADADPEEVSREIEKLEAFVTSSKFAYYEKAARD